jgi:3-oxoacyl-[acyl-carrier-protein] synthase III
MPIGRTGLDFIVNTTGTGDQASPSIAVLADGRFIVTWVSQDPGDGSGTCIRGRMYNPDGGAVGVDFIVNTTADSDQAAPS